MVSHNNLESWWNIFFMLSYHYNWTPESYSKLTPYEIEIYCILLSNQLKEEERRRKSNQKGT